MIIIRFMVFVKIIFFIQPVFGDAINLPEKPAENYVFMLSPLIGFFYGQAEEIVYRPNNDFKSETHSQLLWDIKPVYYYGLQMNFLQARPFDKKGFFSGFSLLSGISGKSGSMENRDWLSKQNSALTNYSKHDNFTKNIFFLDFNAGYSIPLKKRFQLKPFINISYMHFSFYGVGGYGQYAKGNYGNNGIYEPIEDAPIEYFPEGKKVINYTQNWLTGSPGFSSVFYFLPVLSIELSFQISPLILCSALDEHIGGEVQFRDYMRGGLSLCPALLFSFSFKEIFTLSMDISLRYITNTKGPSFRRGYGKSLYFDNGISGAALSLFNAGILFKVNL